MKTLQEARAELVARYPKHTISIGATVWHWEFDGDRNRDEVNFGGSIHAPPPQRMMLAHACGAATMDDAVAMLEAQMRLRQPLADEPVAVPSDKEAT